MSEFVCVRERWQRRLLLLCWVIVMSASNDKNVVPPSKYKPTQLPILTTFSVWPGSPVVIFTLSHKACILTRACFSEQGFPVFRRRLEGKETHSRGKTFSHISCCLLWINFLWWLSGVVVRNVTNGVSMRFFCCFKYFPLKKGIHPPF